MEASLAATGMLEVLATRDVLFMMDSSTPLISTFNCARKIKMQFSVKKGALSWMRPTTQHNDYTLNSGHLLPQSIIIIKDMQYNYTLGVLWIMHAC